MTAAPESAPAPRCRYRWIWKAVLALSLALNLCVVGGVLYFKYVQPHGPAQALPRELGFGNDQRSAFRTFLQTVRAKGQAMREKVAPLEAQLAQELAKPQPDRDKIVSLVTQISDQRREFMIALNDAMLPFLATLSPEQRQRFIEMARRRQDAMANRMMRRLQP